MSTPDETLPVPAWIEATRSAMAATGPPLWPSSAVELLLLLRDAEFDDLPVPEIAWRPTGGVRATWRHDGRLLRLRVGRSGRILVDAGRDGRFESTCEPDPGTARDVLRVALAWLAGPGVDHGPF